MSDDAAGGAPVRGDVTRLARAKINLALHVTGRRPDGYHTLDSVVVFAELGDVVTAEPASRLSLSLGGPFAMDLGADGDNLVMRAAALMPGAGAALYLAKNLPVAAGLGGGSADAAAALSALAAVSGRPLPAPEAALGLGADVPVCLRGRPARMRGIGEVLEDLPPLPPLWCVLVNPRVACPTGAVYGGLAQAANPGLPAPPAAFADAGALIDWLRQTRNDLEAPARALAPAVARAAEAVAATPGCALARMSGSGATVFGLFAAEAAALDAAATLRAAEPGWWVAAAPIAR